MVDLRKLLAQGARARSLDPLEIFESLDRKTSHVNLGPSRRPPLHGCTSVAKSAISC